MSKTIFSKLYDGESLYDLQRDIVEAFDPKFNPKVECVPQDEHGFQLGEFKVTVEWIPEQSAEVTQILKEIDSAIAQFGSYEFFDKGCSHVMHIDSIVKRIRKMPVLEAQETLIELARTGDEGSQVATTLIGEMEDWDELFEDPRIQELY